MKELYSDVYSYFCRLREFQLDRQSLFRVSGSTDELYCLLDTDFQAYLKNEHNITIDINARETVHNHHYERRPTLLINACERKNKHIAWWLIHQNAALDLSDDDGQTALHMAVEHGGAVEIVKMLLDAGARTTIRNNESETPLDIAKKFAKINYYKKKYKKIIKLIEKKTT